MDWEICLLQSWQFQIPHSYNSKREKRKQKAVNNRPVEFSFIFI